MLDLGASVSVMPLSIFNSLCLPMFLANCGYLELVLVLFIINSPLQFCIVWLIPVMITNLVGGSRMTMVGCRE